MGGGYSGQDVGEERGHKYEEIPTTGTGKGRLQLWIFDSLHLQRVHDEIEVFGEEADVDASSSDDDSSDSDVENDNFDYEREEHRRLHAMVPALDKMVEEGSVYDVDREGFGLVVVAGRHVIVWDLVQANDNPTPRWQLLHPVVLTTSQTSLYAVSLSATQLVASGSDERILIWTLDSKSVWSLQHHLNAIRTTRTCSLGSNCVLSLQWLADEGLGVFVSGGYDGCVSMWTVGHRLTAGES